MHQRLVGKLIYLTLTRPDITYAMNVVNQFMHVLSNIQLMAVQRILCYLKKNLRRGLLYIKQKTIDLEAYIDTNWTGSVDDRRSNIGHYIYLDRNLVI